MESPIPLTPSLLVRLITMTILIQTASFAVRPMVSYRALEFGADPVQLGLVTGAYSLLSIFLAVPAGRWADRAGAFRPMLVGVCVMVVACVALMLAPSLLILTVCQACFGGGHLVNLVGMQAVFAAESVPSRRDRGFAAFTTAASMGQFLGPAAAGMLATAVGGDRATSRGAVAVFGACALVCLAAVALTFAVRPPRPVQARSQRESSAAGLSGLALLGILRIRSVPEAIVVSVTVLTSIEVLLTYLPAYGEANDLTVQEVSFLLMTRGAASVGSRFLIPPMSQRLGHKRLLIASTVIPAVLLLVWPTIENHALMYAAMVVIGFGLGIGQPMTMTWIASQVPPENRGTALALRLSANRFGHMSLPLAVGAVAGAAGIGSIFVSMALLLGISGLAARRAIFDDRLPGSGELAPG